MFKQIWSLITRMEVGLGAILVLIAACIWGGFYQDIFYTRGMGFLLGFLAFSLSAFSIERIRQLVTQEISFKKFGSTFAHLSVVVLLAAGVYGKMAGYVLQVPLPEGETFHEPNAHFYVRLNKFDPEMDKEHRPIQFTSHLSIWEEGEKPRAASTAMNHPLEHKGVKIYQAAYGISDLHLVLQGPRGQKDKKLELSLDGNVMRGDMVHPLDRPGEVLIFDKVTPDFAIDADGKPVQQSTLPANPALLVFYNRHFQKDPLDARVIGWVSKDRPLTVGPTKIHLQSFRVFSGLQFRKDPGLPLAMTGFGFLVVGLAFMFYIPERSVPKNE